MTVRQTTIGWYVLAAIAEGARRSSMEELAENTLQADKVLVF